MDTRIGFEKIAEDLFKGPAKQRTTNEVIFTAHDFEDTGNSLTDFLYFLFVYGYKKNFGSEIQTPETVQKNFFFVRDYIRAVGFDAILHGYDLGENGEMNSISLSFKIYMV